jgi:beta-aspartyl-dipeptidase (metallo-type)
VTALTLIEGGDVHAPEPRGRVPVLLGGGKVLAVGGVDRRALDALGVPVEVIDARGRLVAPGFIDVHEHLAGGSGEEGFSSQSPALTVAEIVAGGITTVVGTLGTDTRTKTMSALIGRAKALHEVGLSAFAWSGGYDVPPRTLTGSLRDDIMFVEEIIGAGEIAIADPRGSQPRAADLARLVSEAAVAGRLARKCGIAHFHVGEGERRLEILRELIDEFDIEPARLYPTHIQRTEALLAEAIDLTRRGATVDMDTAEEDLGTWVPRYMAAGGDLARLTVSSDADSSAPHLLWAEVAGLVRGGTLTLEQALALITRNPARALQLEQKGCLDAGADADVVVLEAGSLDIVHVLAGGRRLVDGGRVVARERFEERTKRRLEVHGEASKLPPLAGARGRTATRAGGGPDDRGAGHHRGPRGQEGRTTDPA